jgi:hypothetical protein
MNLMAAYEKEENARVAVEQGERAVKRAEDKMALEEAWKGLAIEVLSTSRVDPQTQGKSPELFTHFDGEITEKHIRALQSSNYGRCFREFLTLWEARSNKREYDDLELGMELFRRLSQVTHSVFREIQHYQKDRSPLSDEEVLSKAVFSTTYYWDSNHSNFNVFEVGEQLSCYLQSGFEWNHLEKCILRMSVRRAYDVEMAKGRSFSQNLAEKWFGKDSIGGALFWIFFRSIGFSIPKVIGLAISIGVFLWSMGNLEAGKHPLFAVLGLYWVAISVFGSVIHYGTREIRHNVRKLVRPPFFNWNQFEPFIDADLHAMNAAVNGWRVSHVNLRLVREQLTRLQISTIEFPIQLLTLIDRSIGKGCHYW